MNNMWGSMAQYNEIYWPWPIAIYLFLAGLSAGAMMVAIIQSFKSKNDATYKAASFLAPLTIIIGLGLLVLDLGKPLSFYWILLKYNFDSVMSIGVALLLVYTPLCFVYALVALRDSSLLVSFKNILDMISKTKFLGFIELVLFVLAVGVGAYTGFLLSAVSKIVLWNNMILPVLFLISGLSSGIAASVFCGIKFFNNEIDKESISKLLKLDLFSILAEIVLICMLFVHVSSSGVSGEEFVKNALFSGSTACLFWCGVVLVGLVTPILLDLTVLKNHAYKPGVIVFNTLMVLIGVIALRCYIVYAGQMFTGI